MAGTPMLVLIESVAFFMCGMEHHAPHICESLQEYSLIIH